MKISQLYEDYLKNLDKETLRTSIEVGSAMLKKYGNGFFSTLSSAIEKSDKEIFEILRILDKTQNLNSKSLDYLLNITKDVQNFKVLTSQDEDKIQNLIGEGKKIDFQKNNGLGVVIKSENQGYKRNLQDDLDKLLN